MTAANHQVIRARWLVVAALSAMAVNCGGAPSAVNLSYQPGRYSRQVTPVRVGVFYADDQRPGWPANAAMRIFARVEGADDMCHVAGEKAMAAFVAESLRSELAAAGMKVSSSSEFNRSGASLNGKNLRDAGVDRIVFARINYFGFVSPVPQSRADSLAEAAEFMMRDSLIGLPLAIAHAVAFGQMAGNEGVTFNDDTPGAHAYVDIDLWVVDPKSGEVVWADTARDKRSFEVVREAVPDRIEVFLPEALYVAVNRVIWRTDFLAAMGAALLPAQAGQTSSPIHEQNAKKLFAAERFADAASEFKKAYDASSDPAFLYNVALCYRRAGNAKLALPAYEEYLKKVPNSPQRSAVEKRIAELKQQLGDR
jgi:hypothetical protein